MTITSLILAVVVIVVIYFVIKILSPIVRAVVSILVFLAIIYLLQYFFKFSFTNLLGPVDKYLHLDKWNLSLNGVIGFVNHYINQAISFFRNLLGNTP